jgi:hypothetical protein
MWKAHIERNEFSNRASLTIGKELADGSLAVLTDATFKIIPPYGTPVSNGVALLDEDIGTFRKLLQAIVDEAWKQFSIQPSDAVSGANAQSAPGTDAQSLHLADMRKLVGKLADVDLGNSQ